MAIPETTKFAVITEKFVSEVHERKIQPLHDDQVLVKVKACNLCTSEYGVWNGARLGKQPLPFAFGHEYYGTIAAIGDGVQSFKVGDTVGVGYDWCGECDYCKRGETSQCPHRGVKTIASPDGYYGGFGCGDYVVKSARALCKMNPDIDPSQAAFVEPLGTVIYGLRKLRIQVGETLVISGAGTMGILNALAARQMGCHVILTEMMPKKIETCKAYGFDVIDISQEDPVEAIKRLTNGHMADAVVVAVGVTAANDQALEMVKEIGGRILMFAAGYPKPELNIDSNTIHYRKLELLGTFSANIDDFRYAAEKLSTGEIDVSANCKNKLATPWHDTVR
ncbi:zinc-binding dehydrogenase [Lacticaseibacillus baoqingensis]|uniref:Zinc-binding dehydrogenase n=1 Tax=Lacticaseibacillus baoqingensis TaxID=2486013 RepID=A0ABW4EBU5_9LACO